MKIYVPFLLFISLLPLSGCKRNSQTPDDTVVIGISAAPPILDPRFARDSISSSVRSLLFSSLVRVHADGENAPISIEGDLAESWSYKNLVYHFNLRPNVKFTDGTPLSAEDIEFSFQEYQKDNCPFASAFKKIKKVKAQYDGQTHFVDIEVSNFESTFYMDLAIVQMLPKKKVLADEKEFANLPMGTGAFRLEKQNENELFFSTVEGHYTQPKIKKLHLKVVRDDNTRFQKLYKGSLDLVQTDIPLSKMTVFKSSPRFQTFEMPGANLTYLLLNQKDPLLKNLKVRQAINLAIHRAEIIKYKLEGYATPASSLVIPSTPFYDASMQLPETDIEKGKSLISDIPQPIELELKTSNQRIAIENGRILAHQLEKLGFSVRLKSFEWGTYYEDITKGQYQLATMRFVGIWDPDIYRLAFHSAEHAPKGMNRSFYVNKELDQLLERGNKIENLTERIEHYKKIQKIIFNDLPIIPLWYDMYVAVVNKKIKNFVPSPLGGFQFIYGIEKESATND